MVNRTKKELYEENKSLRKNLEIYRKFWETDAIEECTKQNKFIKKSLYIASVVLLIISAFLLGLGW